MKSKPICFLSHPYHRGGVTQWMANAFNSWNFNDSNASFITVRPSSNFISQGNRPLIVDLLTEKCNENIYVADASILFELGTLEYRASIYRELIVENIKIGMPIIPSDDEACWMACASLADKYPMIAVVHSYGDNTYFTMLEKYRDYIALIVAVSNRVLFRIKKNGIYKEMPKVVIPCGVPFEAPITEVERENNIVWIGRLEEFSKRVSDIPKIISNLNFNSTCCFHIIGDGDKMESLNKFKRTYSGPHTIKIHGWLASEQIKKILYSSKVLLQTSNYEGMSVSVMEAISSGCLIVSTRVSGVEDYENEMHNVLFLYETGLIAEAVKKIIIALESYGSTTSKFTRDAGAHFFDIARTNNLLSEALDLYRIINVSYSVSIGKRFVSSLLAISRYLKWNVKSWLLFE